MDHKHDQSLPPESKRRAVCGLVARSFQFQVAGHSEVEQVHHARRARHVPDKEVQTVLERLLALNLAEREMLCRQQNRRRKRRHDLEDHDTGHGEGGVGVGPKDRPARALSKVFNKNG